MSKPEPYIGCSALYEDEMDHMTLKVTAHYSEPLVATCLYTYYIKQPAFPNIRSNY
jgi:hypothetical protein